MVVATLTRAVTGHELAVRRAAAVTRRNLTLLRSAGSYGWLVAAGFVEPLLYLLAIGWGVGALVGSVALPDGSVVPYRTYIAPAMLAASAMNGAVAEVTINFFAKLRYWKLYTPMLNTPIEPEEIAVGELGWATARAALYCLPFVAIMVVLGLTDPVHALAALPAALLVAVAFGGLGLALSTFMRGWHDFDYWGIVQFGLFMFSGTFVPLTRLPVPLQAVVGLTPLVHGVDLVRGLALGRPDRSLGWDAAYLLLLALVCLAIATRRMRRLLWK